MMELKVADKRELADGIWLFELVDPAGADLPAFEAGGHVPVETPSGAMRHYSLSNDPAERHRYQIAVKLEPESRGGSRSMVENVATGDLLKVDAPGNDFPLGEAPDYLLIAGGIGITPILAMARHLTAGDKSFRLVYCTRSAEQTAFLDVLNSGELAGEIIIHHDGGDPDRLFDFWDLLENPSKTHVYCCGPKALMEEVRGMTGHWPESAVHFEDFQPVEKVRAEDRAFTVTLARSGRTIEIPADRTILETLRDNGIEVPSSCESGTCGTCKTGLLDGSPDHRDMVLMDEEKEDQIMICVSRSAGGDLVLDI
ncbi:MAG: PDR/VanB family oxidoreductase [Rhodospirillales bacterium]